MSSQRPHPALESFGEHFPEIGERVFIHRNASVIGRVRLAERVSIFPGASLRGDDGAIVIGACTNIQDNATVHMTEDLSSTTVGERCTIGHNAVLHGCTIEDGCLVGMGAIVMDNAVIRAGSMVGAGALVTANKTFEPGVLILGNPAKAVRALDDKEREWLDYSWRHYCETAERYLRARDGAR
ncbi:MAG: gamma carbonic anhydrase family protein [Myxococcales bacterium]|nr:gamma carbonic anhydrase family protein [Myxococcales bacterium]